MRHPTTLLRAGAALAAAGLLATLAVAARAQGEPEGGAGEDPDLSWRTIDGGGGTSAGGDFEVAGTIGQPDPGPAATGGDWSVTGGYWAGDGAAPPPPCPGDLDGSGDVGFGDLLEVLSAWGDCPDCAADLDGSGDVGFSDLLELLSAWGPCP